MDQNIEIAVRIKPTQSTFISPLYYWDSESIQVSDRNTFSYDYVLSPDATQQQVFEKIGFKIISNVLEGYNGCIFAYGQTGSGKTYTMTGYESEEGIIQKCLKTLWNCVNKSEFSEIKMSYFEIYNETIKDLLSDKENLTIRENVKSGFYVEGLTEEVIEKYEDFQDLISHGISVRTIKETKMNQTSSRSHSVLEVNIAYQKSEQRGLNVLKHAKITFIDLAGSEKQKETQVEGQRLKEAANINKSLSNLSLVITKLSEMSQKKSANSSAQPTIHIPYRNSVLTKILKNSLTGKSKVMIICTISFDERFLDETLSTLRFAQTAKSIKMKVKKNEEEFDGTKERLFEEFKEFKVKYNELKELFEESEKFNESLKRENAKLKDEIEKKEVEMNELQINYECLKIESNEIVREMKSQSVYPQMTQNEDYGSLKRSQSQVRSETQFKIKDNNWTQKQQNFGESSFDGRCFNNSSSEKLFNPIISSSSINNVPSSSQLSFFTTNLSSQFDSNTPQKTFFTIHEADEKEENDNSSIFKIQEKVKVLEKELRKYEIEREFFMMDIQLKEAEITELTKKDVFLEEKEEDIKEGHDLFAEMIKNKQFNNAQLKFLKLCLEKSKKDQLAFELIEEEKKNQKARFEEKFEKIKELLLKHVENSEIRQNFTIEENHSNASFLKSEKKSHERFSEDLKRENMSINSMRMSGSQKQEEKINSQNGMKVCSHSNSEKKKSVSYEEVDFTPLNINKKLSQINIMPQMSQSMGMMHHFTQQQSSQIPILMQENRSMMSQSSFKFTNNELEYLKKDYDRLTQELKNTKEELERKNIMLIEKDSLLLQKQEEFDELMDRNEKLIEDIIAENEVRELEKKKRRSSTDYQSIQRQLNDKELEIKHLKQHLETVYKKHQQEMSVIKLEKKGLEEGINRQKSEIDEIRQELEINREHEAKLNNDNKKLSEEIKRLREEYKNIQIDKGFLDSENEMFAKKYNELKLLIKSNQKAETPKKYHRERISYYSLSNYQHNNNNCQFEEEQNANYNKEQLQLENSQESSELHEIKKANNQQHRQLEEKMSEFQLIEVIETKRYEDMYIAAYHFYKQTEKLHKIKELLETKLHETKLEVTNINIKIKQLEDDKREAITKLHEFERMYLNGKELLVNKKETEIELKSALLDKKQQIIELEIKNKELFKYSQLLESKLLERQHKEFENKQKVNQLTTQIRENINNNGIIKNNCGGNNSNSNYHQENKNNNNNSRLSNNNFNRRRLSSSSEESLSSDDTLPRLSSGYFHSNDNDSANMKSNPSRKSISHHNSRKSLQMPLCNQKIDYNEFMEIEEVSNEESKPEKNQSKFNFYETSPSILSKTLTNNSAFSEAEKEEKIFKEPKEINERYSSEVKDLTYELSENKNNQEKPTSIKSDTNKMARSNIFKQKNKESFSKS